jgi:hypothetical protein
VRRYGLRLTEHASAVPGNRTVLSTAATRYAGLRQAGYRFPRAAFPGLRGLALGYTLPPATRVCRMQVAAFPGLLFQGCFPGLRGLALGNTLPPATRVCGMQVAAFPGLLSQGCFPRAAFPGLLSQGCADLPWATRCRPLRGFANNSHLTTIVLSRPLCSHDHCALTTIVLSGPSCSQDHRALRTIVLSRPLCSHDHRALTTIVLSRPSCSHDDRALTTGLLSRRLQSHDDSPSSRNPSPTQSMATLRTPAPSNDNQRIPLLR